MRSQKEATSYRIRVGQSKMQHPCCQMITCITSKLIYDPTQTDPKRTILMEIQHKRIKWLCILFLINVYMYANAQQNGDSEASTYAGSVQDEEGNGLTGVTVSIQESNDRTTTDNLGNFSITAETNSVLIFKKDGFLTTRYALIPGTAIKITLERAELLAGDDDFVEIPFGERSKRYLTAAISQIKTSELPQPSTSSLTNVLSGRLAGLNVIQTGTQPGSDLSVYRVRGRNSFNFVNAMVIVDGIERDLSDIDYEEVESFTVLKDPATLSWYGLRGSHGVLMVTTKKGSPTSSSIDVTAQYGLQTPDHMVPSLNSFEYASLYNEALLNDNPSATPVYDQTALDAFRTGSNPFLFPDNNYQKLFIKNT